MINREKYVEKDQDIIHASTYPEVEVVIQPKEMVLVSGIMLVDILEKFDLIKALVKKVFVVLYDLYTDINACVEVMCLYCFAKSC